MPETTPRLHFRPMTAADFAAVIVLANKVHGDNYLTESSLSDYFTRGLQQGRNLHWLGFADNQLVGLRLTFAPGNWDIDSFCTPSSWPVSTEQMCYFKCAAIDQDYQGLGIGKSLLQHSVVEASGLGCQAGLAHIWRQSPNNSAFAYFSRCGGELIQDHPDRWYQASVEDGYFCPVCDGICHCIAAEMVLPFKRINLG
ncbi:GNAT family N-acetyltransferase [Aliidiomarina minuta]|uniref:GNAT family N-acetyltransferase n=1 Tax=Aliidiomarina minuta TaxID=880057 RepID=A0A432W8P3_9GAMM|nr:GNAT family N-acetyltransferase [Aliidiomarina minuta]RUO26484.1 GNAT family N-acetyltransferase [Aliidiomarina minuta]